MFDRKSRGGQRGALGGKSPGTCDRGNAIIGHRLPAGRLYIHAPAEPCELCARTGRQVKS